MRKMILNILISVIMISIIPTIPATLNDEQSEIESEEISTSILGITIISGFLINPIELSNGRIEANAVFLLYYDLGIFNKVSGIAYGLTKISFKNTSPLLINDIGDYGFTRVLGICNGFRIDQ